MNDILVCLIGALTGSGVTSVVLAFLQRKWAKEDKEDDMQDALVAALKVLMVDKVRWLGKQYIQKGEISLSDKETLEEMHTAYKGLGGNGHLDTVMGEVERLPICGD